MCQIIQLCDIGVRFLPLFVILLSRMVIFEMQKYIHGQYYINSRNYHPGHDLHHGVGEELVI